MHAWRWLQCSFACCHPSVRLCRRTSQRQSVNGGWLGLFTCKTRFVLLVLLSVFGWRKTSEECNRSCWECMLSPPPAAPVPNLMQLKQKISDRHADFVISPCVHLYILPPSSLNFTDNISNRSLLFPVTSVVSLSILDHLLLLLRRRSAGRHILQYCYIEPYMMFWCNISLATETERVKQERERERGRECL